MQGYPQGGYGPPPKKGMPAWAVVLIVLGLLGVLGFGGCIVLIVAAKSASSASRTTTTPAITNATTTTASPTTTAEAEEIEAVEVTAGKLFDDYHANEVAADNKYKGQMLSVTGTVHKIRKDFADEIVVELATSNRFESVRAHLKGSENAKAAKLTTGEQVTVNCKGGGMIIGGPVLRACEVE